MYNLFISLALGVFVAVAIKLLNYPLLAGIIPGALVFFAAYIVLARRISTKVQVISSAAQKELSVQPNNQRERQARVEKAIALLETGLVYDKWQFLIGSEIHAQIGMIKYLVNDLDAALTHLSKANARNYMAHAFTGALFFRKKDYSKMETSFEKAVSSGKKEGLVWSTYAWCQQQLKEKDKALKIMARAVEANPSDEKLKGGLTALQNDKKLKMKPYEPMWWQFGLEQPPMQQMGGGPGRRVQFQRR
jgi:tetratricopeptide (TPR) repeat protein